MRSEHADTPSLTDQLESRRLDLIYELERADFQRTGDRWTGQMTVLGTSFDLEVTLPEEFPHVPPKVCWLGSDELTWHQNADSSLCLYSGTSPGDYPWLTPHGLLDRIQEWLVGACTDWVDEPPDLDLERYWHRSSRYDLLIHPPLDSIQWLIFDARRFNPRVLEGTRYREPPKGRPKGHKKKYGLVSAVGAIATPPRNWRDLQTLLDDGGQCTRALVEGQADFLLLKYTRREFPGVLALHLSDKGSLSAVRCAEKGGRVNAIRQGPAAAELASTSVAVVGVGAVGSFVSQGLYESGVVRLTLFDGDVLRPGNLIRHAARPETVGLGKAEAMARSLDPAWTPSRTKSSIAVRHESLTRLRDARRLVFEHDLVVDAAANDVATRLLEQGAAENGRVIVSAYIENQGRSLVVDVLPGQRNLASLALSVAPDGVEAGCGDPVSPTPPSAVREVAAMTVRTAIEALLGRRPGGELREHGDLAPYVRLSADVRSRLDAMAQAAMPYETGGLLIGWREDDQVVVQDVVEVPSQNPRHSTYELTTQDADDRLQVYLKCAVDDRLGYVGSWHSHPALAPFSAADRRAMKTACKPYEAPLAFFVLATDGITTELHAAWGKHRSGRVKFVELTERDCHIER